MAADVLELESSASFEEIVASFVPRGRHGAWIHRFGPLLLILTLQTLLTFRVTNSISQDEALYINDGRYLIDHWLHGTPMQDNPGSYFSGLPALYPVFAGFLHLVGGTGLVRAASTLFMLLATTCVFGIGRELFTRGVGLLAALLFATAAPILFLGRYATFDAPAVGLLAVGGFIAVRAARHSSIAAGVPLGLVLALAGMVKYASGIFVPGILIISLVAGWKISPRRTIARVAVASITGIAAVVPIALLSGSVLNGLTSTTTRRNPIAATPMPTLVGDIADWVGPLIVLSIVGAVVVGLLLTRWVLAAALLMTSLSADAYQVHIAEFVSLSKHVGFGLIFATPLAAYGLIAGTRKLREHRAGQITGVFLLAACLWIPLVRGLSTSREMVTGLPDAEHNVAPVVARELAANPSARILVDFANVTRFVDRPVATFSHVTDTNYMSYQGRQGLPAFEAALRNHYFSLVVLDTTGTRTSEHIDPLMRRFGYYLASTKPVRKYDTAQWHVWRLPSGS